MSLQVERIRLPVSTEWTLDSHEKTPGCVLDCVQKSFNVEFCSWDFGIDHNAVQFVVLITVYYDHNESSMMNLYREDVLCIGHE